EEERLTAQEDHVDLRLATGEHQEVAAELAAHVKAHPLRERRRGQPGRERPGRDVHHIRGPGDTGRAGRLAGRHRGARAHDRPAAAGRAGHRDRDAERDHGEADGRPDLRRRPDAERVRREGARPDPVPSRGELQPAELRLRHDRRPRRRARDGRGHGVVRRLRRAVRRRETPG
ncbi:hypothetical protein E1294_50615, partial [Nonomuraea diastatica]